MGEGPVRAALPRARRGHRDRHGRDLAARARTRGGRRGPARRARNDARTAAPGTDGGRRPGRRQPARPRTRARLEIGRLQQQIAFDTQQIESLTIAAADIEAEVRALDARREPARLGARRAARRRQARRRRTRRGGRHAARPRRPRMRRPSVSIEGLEADVEAARSEVFAAVNAATALRHAMEHAVAARARMAEQIAALEVEDHDLARRSRARRRRACGRCRCAARVRVPPWRRCASIARRASPSSSAPEPIATGARRSSARASTISPALLARLTSLEELDAARARVRRRRSHHARRVAGRRRHRWGRSPTTSRSTAATSAPSKPASAMSLQHVVVAVARPGRGWPAVRPRAQRRARGLPGRRPGRDGGCAARQ